MQPKGTGISGGQRCWLAVRDVHIKTGCPAEVEIEVAAAPQEAQLSASPLP